MNVYKLRPSEIYNTFAEEGGATRILHMDRKEIAARMMDQEDVNQEEAYYAADQILFKARAIVEGGVEMEGKMPEGGVA